MRDAAEPKFNVTPCSDQGRRERTAFAVSAIPKLAVVPFFIGALLSCLIGPALGEDFSLEINNLHENYVPLQGQYDPKTGNGTIDLRDDRGIDIGHIDILGGTATIYNQQGQYEGSAKETSPGNWQYDR